MIPTVDYSAYDHPEILARLFHPRSQLGSIDSEDDNQELHIPVATDVSIGARFYPVDRQAATILFFHGNGEIVADYQDLAPLFNQIAVNFFPVDYRGYGISTGNPTVTAMMRDCHIIYEFAMTWLQKQHYTGPLMVMGRSLGSASALELAANYPEKIKGLIVESGFARVKPLLQLLGVDTSVLGSKTPEFHHLEKIRQYQGPTLIIHAERDHIIPFADGEALFETSQAPQRHFLKIADANHNDIFLRGMSAYLKAVKNLVHTVNRN